MSEDKKNMFVMKRDFTVSGFGYGVNFVADVPSYVPPLLHTEAMRCGAVPLDAENVDHVQKPQGRIAEIQGEERAATITRAMDKLVADNNRMSFGADGLPTTKAIYHLTGIDLELNERNAIWKVRAAKILAAAQPSNTTITEEETAEIAANAADKEAESVEVETEEKVALGDELGAASAEGPGTEEVVLAEPEKEPKVAPAKKTVKKKAARAKKA